MLGWHVSVYRKVNDPLNPAHFDSDYGQLLAQWQGDVGALGWLDTLVSTGDAIDLGGNGYPSRYTAQCRVLRPVVTEGPPGAREHWLHDPGDIIDWNVWKGKTFVEHEILGSVPESEWLLVVAWDES